MLNYQLLVNPCGLQSHLKFLAVTWFRPPVLEFHNVGGFLVVVPKFHAVCSHVYHAPVKPPAGTEPEMVLGKTECLGPQIHGQIRAIDFGAKRWGDGVKQN